MARTEIVKCDECGVVKGENERWIEAHVYEQTGTILLGTLIPLSSANGVSRIPLIPKTHDLCGSECAVKHVTRLAGWGDTITK